MVIKKVKNPELPKKESSLLKRVRERKEQDDIDLKKNKEKDLEISKEKDRVRTVVIKYLDHLDEQLREKKSFDFWVFPDRSGFGKMKQKTVEYMQKLIDKDIDKYKNRNLASITICTYHNRDKGDFYEDENIRMIVGITILPINNKGIINGDKNPWGCTIAWSDEGFKTTKFSFKLLERILEPVALHKYSASSLTGTGILNVINALKKKGYDLSDCLNPLANI